MRQVMIAGKYYQIHSDVIARRINPWKAKLGGAGLTYADFQNAEMEEYHDFRNGIGKKRGEGSEARLDFSEGIDFSVEGQAVLGPKVTTAGAFGVAPVKIIDFGGATYAIGHNLISKWNTGTSAWDSKYTYLANPIDAIVITDSTDEYLVVSSATDAVYTTDGETWSKFLEDFTGYTEVDAGGRLTVTAPKVLAADSNNAENCYVYKDKGVGYFDEINIDFEIYAASTSEVDYVGGMAVSNTISSIIGFAATDISAVIRSTNICLYRGNVVANDTYACSTNTLYYCTLTRAAGADSVYLYIYSDAARATLLDTLTVAGFGTATKYRYIFGFVNFNDGTAGDLFDGYVQNMNLKEQRGYLADYANRLYSIKADGSKITYSIAKDIDTVSGRFNLTGNYGTLYALFEGKLLADGTPTLYFCGTQGLFTLDTTTEIAYKQEVSYPPITFAGHAGIYWNANVWVAAGYGILKVAPSAATFVGPDQDDGLPSGYQGKIYDLKTVSNWLVFCVNGGTSDKSIIMKRNATVGGNLEVYTTSAANKPIACLHHSPSSLYTNGRLWFGEGTDVKYMMFPDTTHVVKQIATYEYVNDSGYGKLPIFRKVAAISKTALGVAAITKSCDANDYIQLFYGLNGADPTTSLGTFIASPKPTALTFGSGLGLEFYTIQLAIKLFQGATATNSPELESLMFYYYPTPLTILAWQFRIQCTDENAAANIAELEAIRDTNTLVAFIPSGDEAKTSYNVKLTQLGERLMYEEQGAKTGYLDVVVEEVFRG